MRDPIAAWALTYLLHSTVLIGGMLLIGRWVRSPYIHDLLWKVALAGGIVTASFQPFVPSPFDVPLSQGQDRAEVVRLQSPATGEGVRPAAGFRGQEMSRGTPAASRQRPSLSAAILNVLNTLVPLAWMAGAAILLTRLAIGHTRLLRSLSDRRLLVEGEEFDILERLRRSSNLRDNIRVSATGSPVSPMAMLGREIVIPSAIFDSLTPTQKEGILAHELAHLRRRDPEWLALAQIASVFLFFQPLNRIALRRLRDTSEFICDDAAVRQTGDRKALAQTLAALAAAVSPRWGAHTVGMAQNGSGLIRRVSRVLLPASTQEAPPRLRTRVALVMLPLISTAGGAPGFSWFPECTDRAVRVATPREARAVAPAASALAAGVAPAAGLAMSVLVEGQAGSDEDGTAYVKGQKAGATESKSQRLKEGVVSRSFTGPEGNTQVQLNAHEAEIAVDGSWIRFTDEDGFVRATQTSEKGPTREVEVIAGSHGEPRFAYRIDGVETPWCRDAERVIVAGFRGRKAYEGAAAGSAAESQKRSADASVTGAGSARIVPSAGPPSGWSTHLTWSASNEDESTVDGVRHYTRLRARGLHYNPETGEVYIEPEGELTVQVTAGTSTRLFHRTADRVRWQGEWESGGGSDPEEWVRRVLSRQSSLPQSVIETLIER